MNVAPHRRHVPEWSEPGDLGIAAPCGLLLLDDRGRIRAANPGFAQLTQRPDEAVLGRRFTEFLTPGSRVLYETQFGPLLLIQERIAEIAIEMEGPEGARIPVLLNALVERPDGKGVLLRLAMIAAKDRRHYEKELLAERRRAQDLSDQLNDVLESTTDAVIAIDREGRLTFANGHARLLFGYEQCAPGSLFFPALAAVAGEDAKAKLLVAVAEGVPSAHDLRLNDGRRWLDCRIYPSFEGTRFFLRDVTARKDAEEELRRAHAEAAYKASHDALTGLMNRPAFTSAVGLAIDHRERVVIALIDLDRFKHVNDTLGHAVGDRLLQAVAERMRQSMRVRDVVARLGGDEFAVMIEAQGGDRERVVEFAARLCDAIAAPYTLDGHDVSIGASIGIAMAPEHGTSFAELYHHADIALYRVKENGRNAVRLFDEALRAEIVEQGEIGEDLRRAVMEGRILLEPVPAVDAIDGSPAGLILQPAWRDPRHGRLGPGEVQQVAHDAGFTHELSRLLAQTVADRLLAPDAPAFVAVPLHQPLLLDHLREELVAVTEKHAIEPSRCRVVLFDKAVSGEREVLDGRVGILTALGFRIDLGGFPDAACSLGVLERFDFDAVWTELDPAAGDALDLRRLAIEVAVRRGLSAYRSMSGEGAL